MKIEIKKGVTVKEEVRLSSIPCGQVFSGTIRTKPGSFPHKGLWLRIGSDGFGPDCHNGTVIQLQNENGLGGNLSPYYGGRAAKEGTIVEDYVPLDSTLVITSKENTNGME